MLNEKIWRTLKKKRDSSVRQHKSICCAILPAACQQSSTYLHISRSWREEEEEKIVLRPLSVNTHDDDKS